jgi:hypothetical protein
MKILLRQVVLSKKDAKKLGREMHELTFGLIQAGDFPKIAKFLRKLKIKS